MRTLANVFLATIMVVLASGSAIAHPHRHLCCDSQWYSCCDRSCGHLENVSIDIDDDAVILTHHGGGKIKITEDHELYVNGRLVPTNAAQKELLKEYCDGITDLIEYAKVMGCEGAEMGIDGAQLGLSAVSGVFKVLLTSYDSEDFEVDMEREAKKLESRAEKLGDLGNDLEEIADNLDQTHHKLRREIPELRKLGWF